MISFVDDLLPEVLRIPSAERPWLQRPFSTCTFPVSSFGMEIDMIQMITITDEIN